MLWFNSRLHRGTPPDLPQGKFKILFEKFIILILIFSVLLARVSSVPFFSTSLNLSDLYCFGFWRRSSLQPARTRPTSTLQCGFLYSTLWILNHTTLNSQLEFSDDDWTPDQAAPTVSTRRWKSPSSTTCLEIKTLFLLLCLFLVEIPFSAGNNIG